MEIQHEAIAGTMESSDVYISLFPDSTLTIEINSPNADDFYEDIHRNVTEVLQEYGIDQGRIVVEDHGALACTLQARLKTAIGRAKVSQGGESC